MVNSQLKSVYDRVHERRSREAGWRARLNGAEGSMMRSKSCGPTDVGGWIDRLWSVRGCRLRRKQRLRRLCDRVVGPQ